MLRIKRIFMNAILMSIGIVFAKGTYEEGPEPTLLETDYSGPAMTALEGLAGTTPDLPGITLPSYPTLPGLELPSYPGLPGLNLPSYPGLPGVSIPGVDLPSYPTLPGVALPSYPTLPGVNLPGATPEEQQLLTQGMGLIKEFMSGEMPEAFKLGMDKIKNVLAGEYNPLTSPYYKGLKEETARFEEKGISDIRQRSQLGGMLYSEPAMGAEAEFKGILGTGLTKELGRLYEADVSRQAGMIPQLLGYAGLEQGKTGQALAGIGAMAPLAGMGGDIARQQALINQQVGTQQALGGFGVGSQQALINQQISSQQALGGFGVGSQQAVANQLIGSQQALASQQVGTQQVLGGFGVGTQQAVSNQLLGSQQALGGFGVGTQQAVANQLLGSQQVLGGFGVETQQAVSDQQVETAQAMFPWEYNAPIQQYLADWGTYYTPEQVYTPGPFDWLLSLGSAWLGKK